MTSYSIARFPPPDEHYPSHWADRDGDRCCLPCTDALWRHDPDQERRGGIVVWPCPHAKGDEKPRSYPSMN